MAAAVEPAFVRGAEFMAAAIANWHRDQSALLRGTVDEWRKGGADISLLMRLAASHDSAAAWIEGLRIADAT